MSNFNKYISLKNVTVRYEKFGVATIALSNVSLSIERGKWVSIMGPNGSGKTTLLKSISKNIDISSGEVIVGNKTIAKISPKELATTFFYVNQNPLVGSIPQLTVWENLVATDVLSRRKDQGTDYYSDLLKSASLMSHKNQLVQFVSGGQRQILALLIAKMRSPDILLLDEAFASLDVENTKIALSIINEIHGSGKTILHVTHDQELAESTADKIIKLERGKILSYD